MADRARRWGGVPGFFACRGDRVVASPKAQDAVLASLGATRARPPRMKLSAVPDDACAQAPDRAWGWAIQLYALRSRDSWGVGDFGDLRRFARWARRRGASLILINPLGAQVPSLPYEPSPYYSSSRRFLNAAYISVAAIPGAERCAPDLEPLRRAAQPLNPRRLIDSDQVFVLKSTALELILRAGPRLPG